MDDPEFPGVTLVFEELQQIKAHKRLLTKEKKYFFVIFLIGHHPYPLIYLGQAFCHSPCRRLKAMAMAPPFEDVSHHMTEQTRTNMSAIFYNSDISDT